MTLHRAVRRLYVFRHGQTDWNRDGRIQGHREIPLNDEGRRQAALLRKPLGHLGVQAILSSDLGRAVETAEIAVQGTVPIFRDERLRETQFGQLEGLSRAEIHARFGTEFARAMMSRPFSDEDMARFGCETGEAVLNRTQQALLEFLATHPYDTVGVSTHGGVIRKLLHRVTGEADFPAPIPNSSLFLIEVSGTDFRWVPQIPLAVLTKGL